MDKPDLGYSKRQKKKREEKEGILSMNATMISRSREEKKREIEERGKNLSRSFLEGDYVTGLILVGEEQPFIREAREVGSIRRYNS